MFIRNRKKPVNDGGFSLIELSVATGVVVSMAVGGLLVFSGSQDAAKERATVRAAEMVFTNALTYDNDADLTSTTAHTAAFEHNMSQPHRLPNGRARVYTEAHELDDGGVRVMSIYGNNEMVHVIEGSGIELSGNKAKEMVTYRCNSVSNGIISLAEVPAGSTVSVVGSDGSVETFYYASDGTYSIIGEKQSGSHDSASHYFLPDPKVEYSVSITGDYTPLKEYVNSTAKSLNNCDINWQV